MVPLDLKASEFLCFAVMTCELAEPKNVNIHIHRSTYIRTV